MHGLETVSPFSGGAYRRLSEASFFFDALVPAFEAFFGSRFA
jgi:hypothetical protein